jgi:hypothetical protein
MAIQKKSPSPFPGQLFILDCSGNVMPESDLDKWAAWHPLPAPGVIQWERALNTS